jgi:hypothetical protein
MGGAGDIILIKKVALLNYIRCGILRRILYQIGISVGFTLYRINIAVRIREAAMGGTGDIILIKKNETKQVTTYGRTGIYINFLHQMDKKKVWPSRKPLRMTDMCISLICVSVI